MVLPVRSTNEWVELLAVSPVMKTTFAATDCGKSL
jgi:hypothetical protein